MATSRSDSWIEGKLHMPIFSILFCLIVIAVFVGLWVSSFTVCLIGLFTKKRWLKWLGGVPLIALTLLGVFAAGEIGWEIYCAHSPPHVFKTDFGFAPATTTKFSSGYWSIFGDSGVSELHFVADTNTIQQVIKTGFVEISRDEYVKGGIVNGSPTRFFKKSPFGKGFAHDEAYITVNDATGEVYFRWDGID